MFNVDKEFDVQKIRAESKKLKEEGERIKKETERLKEEYKVLEERYKKTKECLTRIILNLITEGRPVEDVAKLLNFTIEELNDFL